MTPMLRVSRLIVKASFLALSAPIQIPLQYQRRRARIHGIPARAVTLLAA